MLQIASGKLFTSTPTRVNNLRGILHTNLFLHDDDTIETAAGTVLPTNFIPGRLAETVFEFKEYIEDPPVPGGIVSSGIEPYIRDFASVLSLGLNVTCTVSSIETLQLIRGGSSTKTGYPPSSFVPRVFDQQIYVSATEITEFVLFVNNLIALKRKFFLDAMQAIKTYDVALHRIPDDFELSYILLVMSVESLAQSSRNIKMCWEDIDPNKQRKFDEVLSNTDEQTSLNVKNLLLKFEQTGSSKKILHFVKQHLRPSFFRQEAIGIAHPLRGCDLDLLLKQAYARRSRFVHHLGELPRTLKVGINQAETLQVEGRQELTLAGLARLARHLILEYVRMKPKVAKECYDYRSERYGVIVAPLAEKYWIGNPKNLKLTDGPKRLRGYLIQLAACFKNEKHAEITDLSEMLKRAKTLLDSGTAKLRRALLALHRLYNAHVPVNEKMNTSQSIERKYVDEFSIPCVENLLVCMILKVSPNWIITDYKDAINEYFDQRHTKNGLSLPPVFDTAILLYVAEQNRLAGKFDCVKKLLTLAIESYPGHQGLIHMEKTFNTGSIIDWFAVLFPVSEGDSL